MAASITSHSLILAFTTLILLQGLIGTAGHLQNNSSTTTLGVLISNISSNTPPTGFYMQSAAGREGAFFALGLCRPDLTRDHCERCLKSAASNLLASFTSTDVVGGSVWQNYQCLVRYATKSFLGDPDLGGSSVCSKKGTPGEAEDAAAALGLVQRLADMAPTQALMSAAGQDESSYAPVQCTRDLTRGDCRDCLSKGMTNLASSCKQSGRGRYISGSCILRYEDVAFFNTSMQGVLLSPPASNNDDRSHGTGGRGSAFTGLVWFFSLLLVNLFNVW